ncbi:hypothetical protein [Amycolatopsis sp. YIM 10]|nr:hypothetical protein [Amycolatopsis sp. YIM 10]QFU88822.1 hypothetical protein YIM_18210 [Amycolatopsis sp. YIM 10]
MNDYEEPCFSVKVNRLLLTVGAFAFATGVAWAAVLVAPWLWRTAFTWY